jgi:redox-sensitive bicupin YhaK (pirin superfamily)
MVTDVVLLHVFLQPGKAITLEAQPMAFVYALQGHGETEGQHVQAQTLINYTLEGDRVNVAAGPDGLAFMFATGTPHNEPITYGGPFVMTTPEQMTATKRRYAQGGMGRLEPHNG